ncbi:low-density lipoprotein receptor-related protein 3 isoform X1 [Lingula anatina]|uniref:Low-density lipoprotein receptor-related protein 3 isoform X1 n=1 Tax=Lingula anatina TaxID=7574 RepID=A0A1S3I9R0_LINAN|nr:low-density lipoprotein receptor-related protein 3 isoform X1 [Lingula anatina]|eukprot:XP_013394997.1 low-density lipoprotein receptor-related protein 3 isoform X1 [Lingula anatina]
MPGRPLGLELGTISSSPGTIISVVIIFALLCPTQVPYAASAGIPAGCHTQTYNHITQGLIQSANYPFNYSSCEAWMIQSDGLNITISFEDLDLPKASNGSCIDFLQIGPLPTTKFCGKLDDPIPKVYISQRSHVWMYLHSSPGRSQSRGRGFSLRYLTRSPRCDGSQFHCGNGACILKRWRCNSWNECGDGSDEVNCSGGIIKPTPPPPCGKGTFLCRNTQGKFTCFNNLQICDGTRNCQDGSDEENCAGSTCKHIMDLALPGTSSMASCNGTLTSPNYPQPYQADQTCDWLIQAPAGKKIQLRFQAFDLHEDINAEFVTVYDGRDERSGVLGKYTGTGIYKPPKVIETSSNELFVKFVSSPDYSKPRDGFLARYQIKGCCIGQQEKCFQEEDCYEPEDRCDGTWHCQLHGGDERQCSASCSGDRHFSCGHKTTSCYLEKERCDGTVDCKVDFGDESNCDPLKCGPHNGTFLCRNKKCIKERWQCDGTDDCQDNSDEVNCSSLPSLRVIIAAVIGSLICGLLLVIALGCTCKLYALRMNEHYGTRNETPMTRLQELFNARPPPPNYDRAMVTSRPYDEVQQEMRAQLQAAQEATEQPSAASGGGSTMQDGNASSNTSSANSSNNAQHRDMLLVFPDSTSSDSDSETELGRRMNQVNISLDSDIQARWRRKRKSRTRRGNGGGSSRDSASQASGNPAGSSRQDPGRGDPDPNRTDASSLLSAGDTASTSTCTDSVIVSMCEDNPKPDTSTIQTNPTEGGACDLTAQDEPNQCVTPNILTNQNGEAVASESCQANSSNIVSDSSSETALLHSLGANADDDLPSSSDLSSYSPTQSAEESHGPLSHSETSYQSRPNHGTMAEDEAATHLLAPDDFDCDDDDVPLLA